MKLLCKFKDLRVGRPLRAEVKLESSGPLETSSSFLSVSVVGITYFMSKNHERRIKGIIVRVNGAITITVTKLPIIVIEELKDSYK